MYSSTHSLVGVHCSGVFKLYLLFEQIGRDNTNMHIACVECGPTLDGAHRNDAVALSPERGYTRDSGDGGHYTHTHTHTDSFFKLRLHLNGSMDHMKVNTAVCGMHKIYIRISPKPIHYTPGTI